MTTQRHASGSVPPLLLRALAGEPVERPPVWFMRQAGRYLPEYRAIRARASLLELCRTPELAAELTLQPLRRFPLDAVIVFSDILLPLQAMGAELIFSADEGPVLPHPVRDRAGIEALRPFDPPRDLPAPLDTLRLVAREASVPVLGFAGAPFTLACYLVEGRGSTLWRHTKALMWSDPEAFGTLLARLADAVGDHLQAQVEAGAAAVLLFDTWAGTLSAWAFRRWALPAARRALSRVKGAPRLYFTRDSGPFLPWLAESGADAIALDWRVDIGRARAVLGELPVQGNLDPMALFAPPARIREEVHAIIRAAGPRGHVFNLGHGIHQQTPIDGVAAAVEAVHAWSWS